MAAYLLDFCIKVMEKGSGKATLIVAFMTYQPQSWTCLSEWRQMVMLIHLKETFCN